MGDTRCGRYVGGGSLKAFTATGNVDTTSTAAAWDLDAGRSECVIDGNELYELVELNGVTTNIQAVTKFNLTSMSQLGGFTDVRHVNPDGSIITTSSLAIKP